MLRVKLNDRLWLNEVGSYGEINYSENHLHGCESASWAMAPRTRHRELHPGATVQIFDSSQPVWTGFLDQPGRDGGFTASGWWKLGEGVWSFNPATPGTTINPWEATRYALLPARNGDASGRGAVPWYGQALATDYSPTLNQAVGTLAAEAEVTLTQILDRWSTATGSQWRVNHLGWLTGQPTPTEPSWSLKGAENDATWSDEEYATHLNVTYMSGAGTYVTFERTSADSVAAAARFGRREQPLDLTEQFGIITLGTAQGIADQVLARFGPRLTFAEPITVIPGQLQSAGGTPGVGWAGVHAGQIVRLWGVIDRSRATGPLGYTDVLIDRLARTRATLTISPPSLPPRSFTDVIAAIAAA